MISLERRDGRPLRIGHRGAAALAPENTLASFRAAVDLGVDLVEFDVLGLDSGELVVAHSNNLHEVSHGAASGSVRDLSLAELRGICPELPTLDEALAFFAEDARETGVHVDLKLRGSAERLVAAVRRFDLVDRTFVSSFWWSSLRELGRLEPGLRTGVSFPRDPLRVYGKRGSGPVVRAALAGLRGITPLLAGRLLALSRSTVLVLNHAVVSPAVVRRAHARGAPVVAWTVDEPDDFARMDAAGVDAVVSNDPAVFLSTLQA